jgi:hypothetical protein
LIFHILSEIILYIAQLVSRLSLWLRKIAIPIFATLLAPQIYCSPATSAETAWISGYPEAALNASGVEPPPTFIGNDLVRLASQPDFRPRDSAYSQYFGTESGAKAENSKIQTCSTADSIRPIPTPYLPKTTPTRPQTPSPSLSVSFHQI